MEKADNVIMAEAEFDWDDVGSWLSLEQGESGDSVAHKCREHLTLPPSKRRKASTNPEKIRREIGNSVCRVDFIL
jgi:mannose-1-phosphate guanylyltransferase